jgi:hypothetical protein
MKTLIRERHAVIARLHRDVDIVLLQHRERARDRSGTVGREGLAVVELALDLVALDRDLLDLALHHLLIELGVADRAAF